MYTESCLEVSLGNVSGTKEYIASVVEISEEIFHNRRRMEFKGRSRDSCSDEIKHKIILRSHNQLR